MLRHVLFLPFKMHVSMTFHELLINLNFSYAIKSLFGFFKVSLVSHK